MLQQLETARFEVSPATRLRLQEALQALSKNYRDRPEELKYVLAPLLAASGDEQLRFYQIFDQWLKAGMYKEADPPVQKRFGLYWLISSVLFVMLLLFTFIAIFQPMKKVPTFFTVDKNCVRTGEEIQLTNLTVFPLIHEFWQLIGQKKEIIWDLGGGIVNNRDTVFTHSYDSPGYKTISLTAGDSTYRKSIFCFTYWESTGPV